MPILESRLFGRRKGRPLRVRKSGLMAALLPKLEIALDIKTFDPRLLFPGAQSLWLEIGFGGGEHLAQQAALHPDTGFIGCEPFQNGIASLLDHIDRGNLTNIRIFPDDARVLLDVLPDASIDRCYVLFADPWPKARHAERRFIGRDNILRLRRVMKSGATLHLASDDPTLTQWMRNTMAGEPGFMCLRDATTPPDDWVQTRYEEKGLKAGRLCTYFDYRRD